MTKIKKKVQTIKTITTKYLCTYFIDSDEPDTDFACYEPTDEEVLDVNVVEEVY